MINTVFFERILLVVAALSLIFAGIYTDIFGLALLAIVVVTQLARKKKNKNVTLV